MNVQPSKPALYTAKLGGMALRALSLPAAVMVWSAKRIKYAALGVFNLNDNQWGRGDGKAPDNNAGNNQAPPNPQNPQGTQPTGEKPADKPNTPNKPNKPSNSNNGGQQPPDLDEVWRDFNDKLNGLFGRKKGNDPWGNSGSNRNNSGNNGGGSSGNPMNLGADDLKRIFVMLLGVVFLGWLATGFFIVQEKEQAVITQFGEYKGKTASAGINWRMPYPIERHYVVPFSELKVITIRSGNVAKATGLSESTMLTQDENIVNINFDVQYRLKSASDYLFNNEKTVQAIELAAQSAIREVVGKSSLNSVLNEKRESIATDIAKSIQAQLDLYKTGVVIATVNIQNVQPPEQVQAAFDDALKAGQDGDRAKNEGQAYANEVIPRAEGAASRLKEEALGYKARLIGQAEGDADRFKALLAEYQKAPQVTRDRLYTETMEQMYSRVTKVMVDAKQSSPLLYMPLDKLMQAVQTEATASSSLTNPTASPASTPSPAPATQAAPEKQRDSAGRTRDREGR